ncbi:hypothetical protein LHYA1_G008366 [Lachnellula hyalina]|uniref:Uncharacterized protein n=1 Tax=Lachnellula hyalina TaxID=1316788 RepID=A0A8H8TUD2_9HELO|nr:uncharacterized protein LHYA1_G008366 [Lachnellula hyalina]TVY22659.1 hypothetical protein LHYA1_G008366 [Lachnellula hyalina]
MSQSITFTEADQALMVAIISQLGIGKIDRKQLQLDLGLATIGTADARLSRFKAKLAKAKGEGEGGSLAPTKAKRASPTKKRKIKVEEAEDHSEHFEDGMTDNNSTGMMAMETPTRKGSGRQARVRSVKEELDEVDYEFQESGLGNIWE